jgi:hypothetical protein
MVEFFGAFNGLLTALEYDMGSYAYVCRSYMRSCVC